MSTGTGDAETANATQIKDENAGDARNDGVQQEPSATEDADTIPLGTNGTMNANLGRRLNRL